ncbi:TetR/AcrR family transcriptional regulator [Actinoplanes solisilvae]|uniref:TetR/AcrR family transcriptional regulator n=1 Tax=Actinoplanes solisilvae TaxID=2486853 RepID=UPI000FD94D97|nr:TetR/AcrR family transcriptional regulator [Actinoplanes solisilvae]
MATHRDELLDAAITVLGERGTHALTHRAVDAAAGLPAGSASNHFRTRDALFDGVVVRFAERERVNFDRIVARRSPTTPGELAEVMAALAREATGPQRALTLARYTILVEAAFRPELRARVLATGAAVDAWFMAWLPVAGSTDPARDAPLLMNHWTGLVLHQLAVPDPAFDPSVQLAAMAQAVLGHPREAP